MTIREAIARNKELRGELLKEKRLEKANAVQLGIEALERVQGLRRFPVAPIQKPLLHEVQW